MLNKTLLSVALSAGLLAAGSANAYTSTTTDIPSSTRFFTLDSNQFFWGTNTYVADNDPTDTPNTDPTKSDYLVDAHDWSIPHSGNINSASDLHVSGWTLLGKVENKSGDSLLFSVTGNGKTSGDFSINNWTGTWANWGKLAIALKVGEGQQDPDWIVIGLEEFSHSGTWNVSGKQSLSHAILFAKDAQEGPRKPPAEVPLPGAAWLMLSGLVGFMGFGRKKA